MVIEIRSEGGRNDILAFVIKRNIRRGKQRASRTRKEKERKEERERREKEEKRRRRRREVQPGADLAVQLRPGVSHLEVGFLCSLLFVSSSSLLSNFANLVPKV